MSAPKQKGFKLEPHYHEEQGMKFAVAGGLYVPAPGETERVTKELRLTQLHDQVRRTAIVTAHEQQRRDSLRVRMKPLDVLKMRSK